MNVCLDCLLSAGPTGKCCLVFDCYWLSQRSMLYVIPAEVFINLFPPCSFQSTLVKKISVWHQKAQKMQ